MRGCVVRKTDHVSVGTMELVVGMITIYGSTITKVNEKSFQSSAVPGQTSREPISIYLDEARKHGWPQAEGCRPNGATPVERNARK